MAQIHEGMALPVILRQGALMQPRHTRLFSDTKIPPELVKPLGIFQLLVPHVS